MWTMPENEIRRPVTDDAPVMDFRWQPTTRSLDPFTDNIEAALDSIAELPANWDCDGACRIDAKILEAALEYAKGINRVSKLPLVVPLADGGIEFEWHKPQGVFILEFESPGIVGYSYRDKATGLSGDGTLPFNDFSSAIMLIENFIKS